MRSITICPSNKKISSNFFHVWHKMCIRTCLPTYAGILLQAHVWSRLSCFNGMCANIPEIKLYRLQSVVLCEAGHAEQRKPAVRSWKIRYKLFDGVPCMTYNIGGRSTILSEFTPETRTLTSDRIWRKHVRCCCSNNVQQSSRPQPTGVYYCLV